MNCPVDGSELRITDRQGIEIDYCPQCRGVWLDRGELDKVLERSAQPAYRDERDERDRATQPPYRDERDRYREDDRSYQGQEYRGKSRRRSLLEDLLDFD